MTVVDVIEALGLTVDEAERLRAFWCRDAVETLTRRIADALAYALEERRPVKPGELASLVDGVTEGPWRVLACVEGWAMIRLEEDSVDTTWVTVTTERKLRRWPA